MNDILAILKKIGSSPAHLQANSCKNERYLHHYFSHQLQTLKYVVLYNDGSSSGLHPEWPTRKKDRNNGDGGRYKCVKNKKIYNVDENGHSGFIDFAIGDYDKPEIGIEFTVAAGWKKEEVIYDMMKLMDSRNPFQKVISYNIVFRKEQLPEEAATDFENFEAAINKSLKVYKERLNEYYASKRKYLFWVIEIGAKETRSWYCGNFKEVKPASPEKFEMREPV